MFKLSGGSRTLTGGSREYSRREVEFNQLRNSGRYSSGYFSDKGGGYVLVERSSMPHEKDEIEAAMYLADKGYIVTLMDESNKDRGSKVKTPDGKVFEATFEQRTPDGSQNTPENIRSALRHGRDKRSDMVVIYQKHGRHSRQAVEQGIRMYEQQSRHRFQQIMIVTRDGRIHRHKHND